MNIYNYDITLQEVPDEVSLTILVSGCPLHCKGCSSPEAWKEGREFKCSNLTNLIDRFSGYVSCVCFLGGEWDEEFPKYLDIVKNKKLKSCLYTGRMKVKKEIEERLDYLKTGPWMPKYGGLDNPGTNQKFIDVKNNKELNYKFQHVHKTN